MFKTAPLENEDNLKIMFGPIVCTNETTLIPRFEDANSSSDGHEEDIFGAGENSTPNPSSTVKGKSKVLHDSPNLRRKRICVISQKKLPKVVLQCVDVGKGLWAVGC
jgi:hypothetical protein